MMSTDFGLKTSMLALRGPMYPNSINFSPKVPREGLPYPLGSMVVPCWDYLIGS